MWEAPYSRRLFQAVSFALFLGLASNLVSAQTLTPRKARHSRRSKALALAAPPDSVGKFAAHFTTRTSSVTPISSFAIRPPAVHFPASLDSRLVPNSTLIPVPLGTVPAKTPSVAAPLNLPPEFAHAVDFNLMASLASANPRFNADNIQANHALVFASAFEQTPSPVHELTPGRLNDPEFYAHHIPGVGPVIEKAIKESKAHPRLMHIFEVIQPEF